VNNTALPTPPTDPDSPRPALPPAQTRPGGLTLAAIGVVYGDIGTSPLYTVKEIFAPATGVALTAANLIGAVS
jgi:KUP system potassium uptake protein